MQGRGEPGRAIGDDPVVVVEDEGGGLAHNAEGDPEDEVAYLVILQRSLQPARRKHHRHLHIGIFRSAYCRRA